MPFSTTIDNSIIDHFTTKGTWTAPAAVYLGLSSTTPTKAGATVNEPSGGGYARIEVTSTAMNAAGGSTASNNTELAWAQATADWVGGVNLTDLVIYDAVSGGNFIGFKALTTSKPVLNGDTAKIASGDLDYTIGGS